MKSRNGKIARLPESIQNELNDRLERCVPGPQILAWLNALPKTRALLNEAFEGQPVSLQNLSHWRQGGFLEWQTRHQLWEDVVDVNALATQMENTQESLLADDVATVLAARYASLLARWDGEADARFIARAKALALVTRSVLQLQRSTREVLEFRPCAPCGDDKNPNKLKSKLKADMLKRLSIMPPKASRAEAIVGDDLPLPKEKKTPIKPIQPKPQPKARRVKKARKPLNASKKKEKPACPSAPAPSNPIKPNQTHRSNRQAARQRNKARTFKSAISPVSKPATCRANTAPAEPAASAPAASETRATVENTKPETASPQPIADPQAAEISRLTHLAEKGDAHSQYCLGARYRDGWGVARDLEKARYWLEKAAVTHGGAKRELHALLLQWDILAGSQIKLHN